ncbi:DNA-3-methyladenine glycosylase [Sporobacter termitidis DSM 10068]|uniref:Putative 3-methyladenine DNA glycosylase n=1 Tax=Sporobacter termitidis DSM 10068 TaxID=1123282 RepID=A0A1M5YVX0_9FIRM|nr:DNA-3-methyladenine glycosylase [Sporobacter termitidis]SHI15998.1 DNA-3-methyladenine glycosylase [Sporobacter termitidis DSM 10068]
MILPREFYERDTLTVARELLGQVLVRETPEGTVRGSIVETEAYLGPRDDAAHSYKGKSERVRVQYGPAGCAYIYMIYGMHYCLNITSGPPGVPEVVLIRALEPLSGFELMEKRRGTGKLLNLCSGPGKLCRAFDIGADLYGVDLCRPGSLYLEGGNKPESISSSKRIGIDYAVMTRDMPWRFTAAGNKFLSRPG